MIMLREIKESDLIGKTIKSIDNTSVNVLKLTFTDDSTAVLWVEDIVLTPWGNVAGLLIEDNT
jgi:hypothetical protein